MKISRLLVGALAVAVIALAGFLLAGGAHAGTDLVSMASAGAAVAFHKQPYHVKAAASHLLDQSGLRTKSGDPLALLAQKFGDHAAEVMTKLGASNQELEGLKAEVTEMAQKMARGSLHGGGHAAPESMGAQFVANETELKSFANYRVRAGRVSMEVKATVTTAADSAGALGSPYRDTTVGLPQRGLVVRDLLPSIRVTTGSVEYAKQITRTNAAAAVAEAATKPESAYAWELETVPMRVLAHWIPASRQVLDDLPQLRGLIDTELMYGLKLLEDSQLLTGSGSGQNIDGLVTNATAFANPIPSMSSPTSIDMIGLAMLQSALAGYEADGIVVNPVDWMHMRLSKDVDGKYLLGAPGAAVSKVLFGLPVVDTQGMTVDKFLVGAFQAAATLYDRWDARIEVSTEHADFFVKNMVAILCEERLGLAVKNPLALTYGDFGRVT